MVIAIALGIAVTLGILLCPPIILLRAVVFGGAALVSGEVAFWFFTAIGSNSLNTLERVVLALVPAITIMQFLRHQLPKDFDIRLLARLTGQEMEPSTDESAS